VTLPTMVVFIAAIFCLFLVGGVQSFDFNAEFFGDSFDKYLDLFATGNLKVIQYSVLVSNLGNFSIPFINDFMHNTLNVPYEISILVKMSYSSIIVIIGFFLVIILITFALMQLFCSCFSSSAIKYHKCQTTSAKILTLIALIAIILSCIAGIVFSVRYRNSLVTGTNIIQQQITNKNGNVNNIKKNIAAINTTIVGNVTIPPVILDIGNATNTLTSVLSNPQTLLIQDLERWLPYTIFGIIILLSIFGIFSVFKEMKIFYAICAILIIIMFLFVLSYAVTGSILSLVLSDYCVGGIDNHTSVIINGFVKDNCTNEALKYYLFCNWPNSTCNPFPAFLTELNNITNTLIEKKLTTIHQILM